MVMLVQRLGTEPILYVCLLVNIASIIFENANVDVDTKGEWTFTLATVRVFSRN